MAKRYRKKQKTIFTSSEFNMNFGRKGKRIVKKDEEMEQAELCQWLQDQYPFPKLLYTADLAGVKMYKSETHVMKTRCARGHPDFMFQEWFQDMYCGLAIEYKKSGTQLSMRAIENNTHLSEQWDYLKALRERELIAGFIVGPFAFKKVLNAYLEGSEASLAVINHYIFPKMKF